MCSNWKMERELGAGMGMGNGNELYAPASQSTSTSLPAAWECARVCMAISLAHPNRSSCHN